MLKPPIQNQYTQLKSIDTTDPTVDINRIQQQIQSFFNDVTENLQQNLFVIEIPLADNQISQKIKDRPMYTEQFDENTLAIKSCYPEPIYKNSVFIGVGRTNSANPGDTVEISTLVHVSENLDLGTVIPLSGVGHKIVGIAPMVGIIRPN